MKLLLAVLLISCNPSTDYNKQIEGRWKCWKTEIDNSATNIFDEKYSTDYLIEFKTGKYYDLIFDWESNYTIQDSVIFFDNLKGYKILEITNDRLVLLRLGTIDPDKTLSQSRWVLYFKKEDL